MFSMERKQSFYFSWLQKAPSTHKTQSALWTGSTQGQQQQRIPLGNQQLVLNQNTNANTGDRILIFKMLFKVPGKINPRSEFA